MKTALLIAVIFAASLTANAQNASLPNPAANLQTLATGSYVIPMDNTLQANTNGDFNLKAYGLIVHLLNNNVKVKWSIKAAKLKDGIDFTATTEKFQPSLVAGGVSRDFKAGPFVIYAADTTGVAAMINAYYTSAGLTGNNRPNVYRLTAAVSNVDIRYDMYGFKPKAQILNDGNNSGIHVAYMTNCGITTANYSTGLAEDLYGRCFTFASEPHNGSPTTAIVTAVRTFVQSGGNFLAQCAAVESYENSASGHFHTTNGVKIVNTNVAAASTVYPNADLSFSQYEGAFDIKQSGSVNNWILETGSSFINNEHNHATGASQTPIGASVAKLTSTALPGGLVFYLGSHDFFSVTDPEEINGTRMYMNAFLTPVAINSNCAIGAVISTLPVKLISFNATLDQQHSKVNLSWATSTETNTSHFVVERSTDAENFNDAGVVFAYGNTTERKDYSLADNISNFQVPVIYYRLRSVDADGRSEYSTTRVIRIAKQGIPVSILTYPNPVTNELRITIPDNWQKKNVTFEILNASGQVAKRIQTSSSSQTETLTVNNLTPGLYIVRVICEDQFAQQKIVKQ